MYSELIGSVFAGVSVIGLWKLGRWSVRNKTVELENLKLQLILSKDNHEELIQEIDKKIEEIQDYNKLSIFDKYVKIEKSE
tara:strand:- start:233 stop:475 length:243 start_codon:yes stop_codon:yes gene_type:complete